MPSSVLIVGAGPTGLVLALWLTKLDVKVRIVDKTAAPGTTSRALAVHARTLELYRQLDLADHVVAHGHEVPAVALWVKGTLEARVTFADIGADITPFPSSRSFLRMNTSGFLSSAWRRLTFASSGAPNCSTSKTTANGSWLVYVVPVVKKKPAKWRTLPDAMGRVLPCDA